MVKLSMEISEIIDAAQSSSDIPLYSDDDFVRRTAKLELSESCDAELIVDTIPEDGVDCIYISLNCQQDTELSLLFASFSRDTFDCGTVITAGDNGTPVFWLPRLPVTRIYDEQGRIQRSSRADIVFPDDSDATMTIACPSGMRTEFCLLRFSKDTKKLQLQLTDRDSFEDIEVFRFHRDVFNYKGLCDLWCYLIQGNIFLSLPDDSGFSISSQHTAYSLYYHMSYLNDRSGKHLYNIARRLIAYAVFLSLGEDGRWRHGSWTDKMETHCVFQASGIDVLVDYYQISGREIFLEKAKAAADYLVGIADHLSDGLLWFLHDSLELSFEDTRLFHKSVLPSKVLGKSESNSLCLNSHIWTMVVLRRLNKLDGCGHYDDCLQKGYDALKKALSLAPAGLLYGPIYWMRDLFCAMAVKMPCKLTDKIRRKYESFLQKGWLFRMKVRYPRLVMPNGFAERDLTVSLLSNSYHLVNMTDLLYIYRDVPDPWLKDIVEKCMRFTVRSSMVHLFGKCNPRAAFMLESLILYTALLGEKYMDAFAEYAPYADGFDSCLSIDLVSNPKVTGRWNGLSVTNKNVIMFAIPSDKGLEAVIVNTSGSDQLVELVCDKGKSKEFYSAIDISGNIIPLEMPINMSKGRIIKIVRKSVD